MRIRSSSRIRGIGTLAALAIVLQLPSAYGLEEKNAMSADTINSILLDAANDSKEAGVLTMQWQRSLPVDERDTAIHTLGGTETRSLVGMDGKLYAGIGYWSDSQEGNPKLPGGQVLVLDAPSTAWKVDLSLDERIKTGPAAGKGRYFAIAMLSGATFKSDLNGQPLAHPAHILLAGAWDRLGQAQVFSKSLEATGWTITDLSPVNESRHAEIRSFGVYRDKITNIEHVFAGARVNNVPNATRIYEGAYDAKAGKIRWNETPENWAADTPNLDRTTRGSGRITAFVECQGKLYASVFNMIFERHDGPHPSWKLVYKRNPERPFEDGSSGFRGLSTVPDPTGKHEQLLVSLEHKPCILLRIDAKTFQAVPEINVSAALTKQWSTPVGYTIAGYNDTLHYQDPITSDALTLIGLHATTPQMPGSVNQKNPAANYLLRRSNGQYSLRQIVDEKLDYKPTLQSVRTMVNSPFKEDPPGTIYAGGFDTNRVPVHNTAWIYRGVPVRAAGK